MSGSRLIKEYYLQQNHQLIQPLDESFSYGAPNQRNAIRKEICQGYYKEYDPHPLPEVENVQVGEYLHRRRLGEAQKFLD
jgi:hypothetical protein